MLYLWFPFIAFKWNLILNLDSIFLTAIEEVSFAYTFCNIVLSPMLHQNQSRITTSLTVKTIFCKKKKKKKLFFFFAESMYISIIICKCGTHPAVYRETFKIPLANLNSLDEAVSVLSAAIYHHPFNQSQCDTHGCTTLAVASCWTLIIVSGLVEKHFSPADSADTSLCSFLWLPLWCSCTQSASCVFGGLEPKSHFPSHENVKRSG